MMTNTEATEQYNKIQVGDLVWLREYDEKYIPGIYLVVKKPRHLGFTLDRVYWVGLTGSFSGQFFSSDFRYTNAIVLKGKSNG